MKIKPNYLYRVLGDLEKEGRVKKKGRQYYPAK
jgi:DNA-binding HxlR family transcriptional regulator